jgi:hypothetical protein
MASQRRAPAGKETVEPAAPDSEWMRRPCPQPPEPHVARMPATMKFHISPHPVQVGLFGAKRQMPRANLFARYFEQAPPLRHIIILGVLRDTTAI